MCGFAGALVFNGGSFRIDQEYVDRMRDTMVCRGPDGASTWVSEDGRVGMGHRRLAVIDLSDAAAQPLCNEDGSLWVCLDGEIINQAAIREELESTGRHRWRTGSSGTEIILHAFEEWGIDCLHRFQGMFAIALWDARKGELWLIRDRIGIKPLYYSLHHGRLTFASEIKALLQDPEQERQICDEAFYHYLSFLAAPAPLTLFKGIYKLPCATWIKWTVDGTRQEQRYWEVWDHTEPLDGVSEEELAGRILAELQEATDLYKAGDVPVGIFLSGGIDSSANAALFSRGEKGPVKTFTIGYRGEYETYRNEMDYARLVAEQIGAEHHETLIDVQDLITFVPQMVYLLDDPIADPVCVPTYYLAKLARDHGVAACQAGEGADELFWGYPSWKTALRLQRLNDLPVPRLLKKGGLQGLKLLGRENTCYYEWLQRGVEGIPIFWSMEAFTENQKKQLISSRLRQKFAGYSSWEVLKPIRRRFEEKAGEKTHLNWMVYLDLNLRLPELLLMRLDRMTMAVGLEGRVPFLDHKVVELALSIPERVKTKNGELKHLMKKAVRGLIPDQVIDRPKQGFAVPVREWFFDRLGREMKEKLLRFCRAVDYLDQQAVARLLVQGKSQKLWYLFSIAMWWNEYFGDGLLSQGP